MKILIVEDEKDLNNVIAKFLKKNNIISDSAFDGEQAMYFLSNTLYDLILLDIMLPKINGFEIIKKLRANNNNTPILIITAKDSVEDKVKGLDLGADDYIIKPFDFNELSARMRALARRKYDLIKNELVVDDLVINLTDKLVTRSGINIELTGKEYEILVYLVKNKNRILSRDQIKEQVWDFYYEGYSNTIDVLIKNIRKKININENSKQIIFTKRGLGYVVKET